MSDEKVVHMVMGPQEAMIIGTAVGILIGDIADDLEQWEDGDEQAQSDLFALISAKFMATNIFTSVFQMLGAPAEVVEAMLATAEGREE